MNLSSESKTWMGIVAVIGLLILARNLWYLDIYGPPEESRGVWVEEDVRDPHVVITHEGILLDAEQNDQRGCKVLSGEKSWLQFARDKSWSLKCDTSHPWFQTYARSRGCPPNATSYWRLTLEIDDDAYYGLLITESLKSSCDAIDSEIFHTLFRVEP